MMSAKASTIDEYISGFPEETQKALQHIRETIKKTAPDAEECISYAIASFKLKGRQLIYFAGFKNHVSVYPAPRGNEAFQQELAQYKGGKGTVQLPLDKPIPDNLITRIVMFRMKENEVMEAKKKSKK